MDGAPAALFTRYGTVRLSSRVQASGSSTGPWVGRRRELVPACMSHGAGRTEHARQPARHLLQQLVSGVVPETRR